MLNVMLYPTPNSILFWDMIVLNGYLFLNILIGWNVLSAERKGMHYPKWVKTADLPLHPLGVQHPHGHGLPVRRSSGQALLADRDHGGPLSLLGLLLRAGPPDPLCMIVRKVSQVRSRERRQIRTLGSIVTYAMILNVFFFVLEFFTAFYSQIPGHMQPILYLFFGLEGHAKLVPWMWTAAFFAILSVVMLVIPAVRRDLRDPYGRLYLHRDRHLDRQGFRSRDRRFYPEPVREGLRVLAYPAGDRDQPGRVGHGLLRPDRALQDRGLGQGRSGRVIRKA